MHQLRHLQPRQRRVELRCGALGDVQLRPAGSGHNIFAIPSKIFLLQPYEGKTGIKTLEYLEAGNRLAMPEKANNDDYGMMLECWAYRPEDRPSFETLFKYFSDNPEYLNLTELLKTQDFQQLGM